MQQLPIRTLTGAIMLTVLAILAAPSSAAVSLVAPQGTQTNASYAASNVGVTNVQASRPVQGGGTDNNQVCQGVVTYNLDHGESDLALDPQNANHLLGASKFFFDDNHYLFHLGTYASFNGGKTFVSEQIIPFYDCTTSGNVRVAEQH